LGIREVYSPLPRHLGEHSGKLTTEDTEKTQRAQRDENKESTKMLFEHGNNMGWFGVIKMREYNNSKFLL
jgi:hypothetical protein